VVRCWIGADAPDLKQSRHLISGGIFAGRYEVLSRTLPAGSATIAILLTACASRAGLRAHEPAYATRSARLDAIRRAQVWAPTDIRSIDMRVGPGGYGSFTPNATVNCTYREKVMSGHSAKFTCVIPPDDEVKVKYGRDNGEVYAEVAATRLFWALGFPADRMYPVRVACAGCPAGAEATRVDGAILFDPSSIERKFKGWEIETGPDSGWAWPELDNVDEKAGGAPLAQRDALKLLAVFVQHSDSKPAQQRLVCAEEKKSREGGGRCAHPVMMVNDLGQTFGRSNLFNRDQVGSVNLAKWSASHVWSDARLCIGDLPPTQTGTLDNPRISEAGRRFLSDLLMQLSDGQLRALFDVARFSQRTEGDHRPTSVDEWVDAFKKKRNEIASRTCPS
jgi:hypothetical protein